MTYDGFISYSHAADGRLAPAIQTGLHRLAKPWHRRRALWIFRDQTGRGNFTGAVDWDGCGSVVEPWFGMNRYNKTYVNPIGSPGTENVDNTNNAGRWSNDQYSALMDEMGSLPLGDPRVMDLYKQALVIWADELPDIPLVQTPVLQLFNTTYWTNWPTADNNYIQPPSHWEHFLRVLTELKPAQ